MVTPEKDRPFGAFDEDDARLEDSVRVPSPIPEAAFLLFINALLSLDLLSDTEAHRSTLHIGLELAAAILGIVGFGWVWGRWLSARRRLDVVVGELARRLELARDAEDRARSAVRQTVVAKEHASMPDAGRT